MNQDNAVQPNQPAAIQGQASLPLAMSDFRAARTPAIVFGPAPWLEQQQQQQHQQQPQDAPGTAQYFGTFAPCTVVNTPQTPQEQ